MGPPHWAEFLLLVLLPKSQREALPGDLAEEFHRIKTALASKARFWYWSQAIRSIGPLVFQFVRRVVGWAALWHAVRELFFGSWGSNRARRVTDRSPARKTLRPVSASPSPVTLQRPGQSGALSFNDGGTHENER